MASLSIAEDMHRSGCCGLLITQKENQKVESNKQRREREDIIGRIVDLSHQIGDMQRTVADVLARLATLNAPEPREVPGTDIDGIRGVLERVNQKTKKLDKPFVDYASKPRAPSQGRGQRILELYSQDPPLEPKQIAKVLKIATQAVVELLEQARRENDPRLKHGDELRAKRPEAAPMVAAEPVEIIKADAQRELVERIAEKQKEAQPNLQPQPVSMVQAPATVRSKFIPSLPKRELTLPGAVSSVKPPERKIDINKVLEVDAGLSTIHGPLGCFSASFEVCDTLQRLTDGQMFTYSALAKIGRWGSESACREGMSRLGPMLHDIGVEVVRAGHGLIKLKRREDAMVA